MSGEKDQFTLNIERLEQAMAEAKQCTRDAHAATKDLRAVQKEVRDLFEEVQGAIDSRIDTLFTPVVNDNFRQIENHVRLAQDEITKVFKYETGQVVKRMNKLADALENLEKRAEKRFG